MILVWKGEKLGEITAPTIKEMRMIKRDLGIRNPITFMNRAVMMMVEKPTLGPDGQPLLDKDGKIVTEASPSDDFDIDAMAMLIAIMLTRNGRPTDFEAVDGDIASDLSIELSEDEKAKLAEEEGKAGAANEAPAPLMSPAMTSETLTTPSADTPLDFGSVTG